LYFDILSQIPSQGNAFYGEVRKTAKEQKLKKSPFFLTKRPNVV